MSDNSNPFVEACIFPSFPLNEEYIKTLEGEGLKIIRNDDNAVYVRANIMEQITKAVEKYDWLDKIVEYIPLIRV
jgi:hypothetical protein